MGKKKQQSRGLGYGNGPFDGSSDAVGRVEQTTGVQLLCEPGEVPENEVRGLVEPEHLARALPVLERTLMVYPAEIRGGLLQKLTLFGKFLMRGKPFLGCAFPKQQRIVLAVRPTTPAGRLRRTLHHEIAHLIEMNPAFDVDSWLEATQGNPYHGKGHRTAFQEASSPQMLRLGFITRYAAKNRHEDFADLADRLWMTPRRTLAQTGRHPILARKVELVTAAYAQFAPSLTVPWKM